MPREAPTGLHGSKVTSDRSAPLCSPTHVSGHTAWGGIRWQVFALACGASFLLYLHRYTWNIVGPKLQDDLGFTNTQAGFLFSLFYYTYACGQIPSGVTIDRFGPHKFLSVITLAWSAALIALGQTTSLLILGFSRLVFGAAQAGCYPALTKVTQQWFPFSQRTTVQGWVATTFGRAGGAMSPIILGTVLMGWFGLSWQTALVVMGFAGGVYAVVFWKLFRNTPQEHLHANEAERQLIADSTGAGLRHRPPAAGSAAGYSETGRAILPAGRAPREPGYELPLGSPVQSDSRLGTIRLGRALESRSLRFFIAQQFLDAGSDVVFVSLIGTYFLRARGFDISQAGWLASLPLWGGALGGIAGGWLNDRCIHVTGSRRWSRSGIGFVGKVIGCVMLALLVRQTSGIAAAWLLLAAKFFSDWSQPTTWGMCTDLGGRFSATVFGIINTAGTIGSAVMPLIFGLVLDYFTTQTEINGQLAELTDWNPLFYVLASMYLASGVCWLLIDCTQSLDREDD